MSGARTLIRGELHLTLEALAHCYAVETQWMVEVYELGLLGRGERAGDALLIPATKLDRVAEILQLRFHTGLNLPGIALLLGLDEDLP